MFVGDLLEVAHLGVAAVADPRLVDDHRRPALRMRVVAVGAGHAGQIVGRCLPAVHLTALMARQAQILPGLRFHVPMGIVTRRAIELRGVALHRLGQPTRRGIVTGSAFEVEDNANLMRMDDLLQLLHFGMTPVAEIRRDRGQAVRLAWRGFLV